MIKVLHASHVSNPTPPQGYGGIELIVDILARYQLREGLDVKVMGVKNPHIKTDYEIIQVFEKPVSPSLRHKVKYMLKLLREARDRDIIHLHAQWLIATTPILRHAKMPILLTLHADLSNNIVGYLAKRLNVALVAISHTQKTRMERKGFKIYDVVYHGIEVEKYPFVKEKEDYLIYVGRIDETKGVHIAVRVANKLPTRLVIIGPITDKSYFKKYIEPYIDGKKIIYLGEVDFNTKVQYLARARALLYPVQYEEFFGIVLAEALACGTPVIGFARGSVTEIVTHGVAGFLVNDEEEMLNSYKELDRINLEELRKDVERRFSASTMAKKYIEIYNRLLNNNNGNSAKY